MRNSADPALTEHLYRHVDRLAGVIGPRHVGLPNALAAAAEFVERELTDVGFVVERHPYTASSVEVANIVAELPGGSRKDEIVILGAHYDAVSNSTGAD